MIRDDISPNPNTGATEYDAPVKVYTVDPSKQADDTLRWSMAALLFQCLAILLFIIAWIPGVDWLFSAWVALLCAGREGQQAFFPALPLPAPPPPLCPASTPLPPHSLSPSHPLP